MLRLHWLVIGCVLSDEINRAQTLEDVQSNKWEKSGHFQGDILLDNKTIVPRNIRIKKLWPYGEVPYYLHPNVDLDGMWLIREAISIIQQAVNPFAIKYNYYGPNCQLKFRQRSLEDVDYVSIIPKDPDDCSSYVGMKGGVQELRLGSNCRTMGVVIHELLHALGFAHQQSAFDRDEYVTIHTENIEPGHEQDFKLQNWSEYTTFALDYDYNSIMHFSRYAFAKKGPDGKPVGPTITNKLHVNKNFNPKGNLSSKDKQKLRLMYCPRLYKPHLTF